MAVLASVLILLDDPSFDDLDFIQRTIFAVRFHQTHPLNNLHTTLNSAKDRVFTIKPGSRSKSNEELTAIRVRTTIGHTENPGTGMFESRLDLVLELLPVDG